MKRCNDCGLTLPLDLFAKAGKEGGVQRYKSRCRKCLNALMRTSREDATRTHVKNVREEVSPHGKGIVPLTIKGWGYAHNLRAVRQPGKGRKRNRAVSLRDQETPDVVVSSDNGPELLEGHP